MKALPGMSERHIRALSPPPATLASVEDEPARVVKSVYESQHDILRGILKLCGLESFDADITYGNGSFYSEGVPEPLHRFDIDPQVEGVAAACSTQLPIADASLRSVVFDPPFLTYVRQGRTGNGSMVMSGRFGGYWRYDELEAHYRSTLKEASRVLQAEGILVFKCQDIVHNHRLHPTHAYVMQWAEECGFRLKDLFILPAKHRLPSPNRRGAQKHARIHHSYFLVFARLKGKR